MHARIGLVLGVLMLVSTLAAQSAPPFLSFSPLVGGCPGTMTLSGTPGGIPFVAIDTGPGPSVVPGLGLVELDLGPAFFVLVDGFASGQTLNSTGIFSLELPLPAVAATVTIYAQALVFEPAGAFLSPGATLTVFPAPQISWTPAPSSLPAEALTNEDTRVFDADSDGDQDLFVINSGAVSGVAPFSRLLINQGGAQSGVEGVFVDETSTRFQNPGTLAGLCAAASDVDQDGDLDLFFGTDDPTGTNLANLLFLNQGGAQGGLVGTFLSHPSFPGGSYETQSAVFVDIDGDSDPDLVLGNGVDRVAAPQPCELLLNVGGGSFLVDPAHFPTAPWNTPGETDDVVAGDFDQNGSKDLILIRDGVDIVLLNSGLGTFSATASGLLGITDNSTSGSVGDVDGDGDLDVYVTNLGAPDRLLRNDGAAGFSVITLPTSPSGSLRLDGAMADLDQDGDLDLVAAAHTLGGTERSFVMLNQGSASAFVAVLLPAPTLEVINSVVTGDMDGDGDQDIYLGNNGSFGPSAQDSLLFANLCF